MSIPEGRCDVDWSEACCAEDVGTEECRCEKCINDYMSAVASMDASDFE